MYDKHFHIYTSKISLQIRKNKSKAAPSHPLGRDGGEIDFSGEMGGGEGDMSRVINFSSTSSILVQSSLSHINMSIVQETGEKGTGHSVASTFSPLQVFLFVYYTLIKKKIRFSSCSTVYKENYKGSVAKSYMTNGLLIYV